MKPNSTTEQCIEWLNDELSCEDGTSEKYFYFLTTIRDKLLAAQKMAEALQLVMPLAKGYSPEGQTIEAKRTCRSWIEHGEKALAQWKDTE